MPKAYYRCAIIYISTIYLVCVNTVVDWRANTCPQLWKYDCLLFRVFLGHTWPDTAPSQQPNFTGETLRSKSLCAAFMGVIGGWSPLSLPFAGVWSCRLDKMCCTVRPWGFNKVLVLGLLQCDGWTKGVTHGHTIFPQLAIGNPRVFVCWRMERTGNIDSAPLEKYNRCHIWFYGPLTESAFESYALHPSALSMLSSYPWPNEMLALEVQPVGQMFVSILWFPQHLVKQQQNSTGGATGVKIVGCKFCWLENVLRGVVSFQKWCTSISETFTLLLRMW